VRVDLLAAWPDATTLLQSGIYQLNPHDLAQQSQGTSLCQCLHSTDTAAQDRPVTPCSKQGKLVRPCFKLELTSSFLHAAAVGLLFPHLNKLHHRASVVVPHCCDFKQQPMTPWVAAICMPLPALLPLQCCLLELAHEALESLLLHKRG
jgi:hypothetical protein